MFICICHAVTDRDIRRLAAAGVNSLEELKRVSGCGDCCGQCAEDAETVLSSATGPSERAPLLPIHACG